MRRFFEKWGNKTLKRALPAIAFTVIASVFVVGRINRAETLSAPENGQTNNEAASFLNSIADFQIIYFGKNNRWAGYPNNDKVFETLGWKPEFLTNYAYYCGDDRMTPSNSSYPYDYPDAKKDWPFTLYPEVSLSDFVCMAVGNIDRDPFPDVWMVNKFKRPTRLMDDTENKVLVNIVSEPFDPDRFFAKMMEKENLKGSPRIYLEINVAAYRLDLYEDGRRLKSYPIAIGMMKYKTPLRDFTIERIEWNPWWIPPDAPWTKRIDENGKEVKQKPKPPGPGNPLGPVKIVLQNSVLLHGTNKPSSIGKKASHACMRMYPDDASDLAWKIMALTGTVQPFMPKELYRDKSRRTYTISLLTDVQVTTVYRRVEVYDNNLLIHTDPYVKQPLTPQDIKAKLDELGVSSDSIGETPETIVKKAKLKTVSIPIK